MSQMVEMTQAEVRFCADLALNRWMMKFGSEDRPNYKEDSRKEPEIAANTRSIVSEFAVAKLWKLPHVLPFYENNEHYYRKNIPDVLPNLEIRTLRTFDAIPVWEKDRRSGLLIVGTHVHDRHYYSKVEVFGWRSAETCYEDKWYYEPEKSWRIPREDFNDSNPFS